MATSGTVGTTRITTNKLIEKAARRTGLMPQALTPEIVDTAIEDLFMLMMSLSSRGLNLWCVDQQFLPLKADQRTYTLPVGTIDVLNVMHCTPSKPSYVQTNGVNEVTVDLADTYKLVFGGVLFDANPTVTTLFQGSDDGVTWTTLKSLLTTELQPVGYHNWFQFNESPNHRYFRLYAATYDPVATPTTLELVTGLREIAVSAFNRDDYANQPNKASSSATVTNYFFEKLMEPQVTCWPVPSVSSNFLRMYRYRQVQDIGQMMNEIEVPTRWLESVVWHLALRLSFELPGIDPERRKEVAQMAATFTVEAEGNETDNSPVYFRPNIGVYTR